MPTTPKSKNLDSIFEALASEHRREIIYALGLTPHSISQLAIMRDLSLPAIHKHIKLLETSGLILHKKIGRTHFIALNKASISKLQDWLMQFQTYWGNNQDSFANYEKYLNSNKALKGGDKK